MRRIVLCVALVLAACESDVEIVGRCVADGDPVRVVAGGFGPSPGLLDGQLLVAWRGAVVTPEGLVAYEVRAAWFDEGFALVRDLGLLGVQRSEIGRLAWARDGDALLAHGLLGVDAIGEPIVDSDTAHRIVRAFRDGTLEIVPNTLPRRTGCSGICSGIRFDDAGLWGGFDARSPVVAFDGRTLMGASFVLPSCEVFGNLAEPIVFTASAWSLLPTRVAACDPSATYPNHVELVVPHSGEFGLLFRVGSGPPHGHVHYMRADAALSPVGRPVLVGGVHVHFGADGGHDIRGVALGPDGVLFRERTGTEYLLCHELRMFHGAGGDARSSPWQLGCFGRETTVVTRSVDLVELPDDRAVVVWGERTGYGLESLRQPVTSSTPWAEGAYLAMVAASGRRGSEIVRVTAPESTALRGLRTETSGPFPGDFTVAAVSEGDRVVVTWSDARPDAPGIYARSFHCGPDVE